MAATMVAMLILILTKILIEAIGIETGVIEIEAIGIETGLIEIEAIGVKATEVKATVLEAIGAREKARAGSRALVRAAGLQIAPGTGQDIAKGKLLGKNLEALRTGLGLKPASAPRPNLQDLLHARGQAVSESNPEERPPDQGLLAVTGGEAIKVSSVAGEAGVDPLPRIKAAGGAAAGRRADPAVAAAAGAVEAAGARLIYVDKKTMVVSVRKTA